MQNASKDDVREATDFLLTRYSGDDLREIFKDELQPGDEKAIRTVVQSKHAEILQRIRQEAHNLERAEAKRHLHLWVSVRAKSPLIVELRRRARYNCSPDLLAVKKREMRKHGFSFQRITNKSAWREQRAELIGEFNEASEIIENVDRFVQLCIEIDSQWRNDAIHDNVVDSHVIKPTNDWSAQRWCKLAKLAFRSI